MPPPWWLPPGGRFSATTPWPPTPGVVPTPRPAGTDSGTDVPDSSPPASASALFTPSVSEDSTKAELYEVATELKIEGRSKMNKSELLDAIRAAS